MEATSYHLQGRMCHSHLSIVGGCRVKAGWNRGLGHRRAVARSFERGFHHELWYLNQPEGQRWTLALQSSLAVNSSMAGYVIKKRTIRCKYYYVSVNLAKGSRRKRYSHGRHRQNHLRCSTGATRNSIF